MSATADEKLEAANWDLEPLVENRGPEAVEQMLAEARDRAEAFAGTYRGRVTELDSAELAEAMRELGAIHDLAGRAGSYAMLSFSLDTMDPERGARIQKARSWARRSRPSSSSSTSSGTRCRTSAPTSCSPTPSSGSPPTTSATSAATARTSSPSPRSACSRRRT